MLGNIEVEFVLKTPIESILQHVAKKAEKHLNTKLRRIKKILVDELPKKLESAIFSSVTYQLLNLDLMAGGPVYGGMGVEDLGARLEEIIHYWCQHPIVDEQPFKITQNGISGGLTVKYIKGDYSDVLSLPAAKTLVSLANGGTFEIDWLEWLLLGGSGYIIREYRYLRTAETQVYSRTDTGIMVPQHGGGWTIPIEYQGTQDDNFLTRILDETLAFITKDIFSRIEKYV